MLMSAEEDSLVRTSPDKLPGHTLALSMQKVWEVIREQKDLNLPAHKVTRHPPSFRNDAAIQITTEESDATATANIRIPREQSLHRRWQRERLQAMH